MADLKAYLAQRYMSGPKADAILARKASDSERPKKRKKKTQAEEGETKAGLVLRDEDVGLGVREEDETELESPIVTQVASRFLKTKGAWSKLADPSNPNSGPAELSSQEQDEGNAEASTSTLPVASVPKKRKGGLRTAAELAIEQAAHAAARAKSASPEPQRAAETIHRDESGRVLDLKALRAEEKRKLREEQEKEAKRMEWGKGIVQAEEKEERRKREERERLKDVARHADDVDMNNEMRQEERWNDPAAAFLTKKKTKQKGPQKPKYNKGPIPMNRFGIPPGYRWDGVDRSTGFEKKYFQYQNAGQRRKLEAMQWSVEDM